MTTAAAVPTSTTAARPRLRLNFGLIAAVALSLLALWPLLAQPGLPRGEDTLYHIYRAAEMDRAWSRGALWPRWAESFYLGYGSPLFHYYAGGTYVVTSLLARLFSLDTVDSARALIALCMVSGGVGMYLWLRARAGLLAGVVAAVCYVYSPYFVFTEPYGRGALPELLALTLLPFVLWRYDRLLRGGGPGALALAALSSAALILTHNLMAVVCSAALAAWAVWQLILNRIPYRWFHAEQGSRAQRDRSAVRALLALAVGILLTAFFWLPVLAERDAVRLENLTALAQLDYRNFFVPLPELLMFSPRVDAGALNGLENRYNLGAAQWALALSGLAAALGWRVAGQRPFALFLALVALALIGLMLPQAEPLWAALPPLAFLQFPWRLLGPAGALLAALAGFNTLWIERLPARAGALAAALIVAAPVLLALPTLYVDEWDFPALDTSVAAYHAAELDGHQRGTTFSNEYLPRTVIVEPGPTQRLLDDYADGFPVDHAHHEALPPCASVTLLENSPQRHRWRVSAPAPFAFEALIYYFPGWAAEVNGRPVSARPSEPHGLIVFDVPAGEHEVTLYLGTTPPRTAGALISLLAAGAVLALGALVKLRPRAERFTRQILVLRLTSPPTPLSVWSGRPRQRGESDFNEISQRPIGRGAASLPTAEGEPNNEAGRGKAAWRKIGIVAGWALALTLLLALMRKGVMWEHSPPGEARLASHQTSYRLGDRIRLIGYDLNATRFRPGDTLALTVYWHAVAPPAHGYASFVHVSQGGPPLAQADKLNPADLPTLTWTPDGFVRDAYRVVLPVDMPPGAYALTVGLYTCDTRPPGDCGSGDRLPVTERDGRPLGDAVPLARIEVR
ncbi:MAG: 6-pyruvoyl-tetrahydropterin synthase-related protein [Aggregatilineales bacterium]